MALRTRRLTGVSDSLSGTNLARAGDYNQRVVLQAIRAKGMITRSELAALTGLTHQSAINISKRLISDDLVIETGRASAGRGHPAAQLAINPEGAYALGLNIDREHVTLVLMNLTGIVQERFYLDKHFALPDEVIAFVRASIDTIFQKRLLPRKRLIGLGIAIPERLGGVRVAGRPAAYDEWSGFNAVQEFFDALQIPVYAENDATAAALGELQFGAGLQHSSFVYTLISAGLGCGLIINGQPYPGGLTHAGEIGNIPIRSADPNKTYLWHAVSLYALYDTLAAHGITATTPADLNPNDAAMAIAIDAWVKEAADAMIEPFLAFTYILSPEVHVIGGQLPEFITKSLCTELNARLPRYERDVLLTGFKPSATSMDASALGAAVMVFQNRLLPRLDVLSTKGS